MTVVTRWARKHPVLCIVALAAAALSASGGIIVMASHSIAPSAHDASSRAQQDERVAPPPLTAPTSTAPATHAAPAPPAAIRADAQWVANKSVATGIDSRALEAYANAVLSVDEHSPACHLGWSTLAAIASVESLHGTIDGAHLDTVTGVTSPRIIGPALSGGAYDAIRDTDGGALDGDPVWDRAVGPFQFIPTTWLSHATDGDGDGVADIDDLDDAAATAASYLCSSGADLSEQQGWLTAIASYNSDPAYASTVATEANRLTTVSTAAANTNAGSPAQ